MVAFGSILNKILGINPQAAKEMQEEAKNLQERMRTAQTLGDYQMMRQLQHESMQLTRKMMTKQFLPQCLRLILFLVIFYVIGFIYADYSSGLLPFTIFGNNGWFSLYLIFHKYYATTSKVLYPKFLARGMVGFVSISAPYPILILKFR